MRKLARNDLCWCGSGKKYKKCHLESDIANGEISGGKIQPPAGVIIKTEAQIRVFEKAVNSPKIF